MTLGWKQQRSKPGQALPEVSPLASQLLPRLQGILGCKHGHRSYMGTGRAGAPTPPSRGLCRKQSCIPGEWDCVCNPCCLRDRVWVNVGKWVGVTTASEGIYRKMFRSVQCLLTFLKCLVSWFTCSVTEIDSVCIIITGCKLITYHQLATSILVLVKQCELVNFFLQQYLTFGGVAELWTYPRSKVIDDKRPLVLLSNSV